MTQPETKALGSRAAQFLPAVVGASAFGCADVLTKVTLHEGADVLTLALFRGLIGVPLIGAWLLVGTRAVPLSRHEKWLSLAIGVIFAANVYWLFKAIEAVEVPVAITTYFAYPLLTGLAAATTGLEAMSLRGAAAAVAAFLGLALMIGAHPGGVALTGIGFALAAACCRVVTLLLTRARLGRADSRLVTWYSLISATVVFALLALASRNWQAPASALGWGAMIGGSVTMTVAVLAVFVSIGRIGPFRTALFMNLEPLLATIGSALFLGETITPLQAVGGAVMIAALVAFQLRR